MRRRAGNSDRGWQRRHGGVRQGRSHRSAFRLGRAEALEPRAMLAANVIISEIVATNNDLVFDEDGDTPDLIELYNSGPGDVNLSGWYLTDNAAVLDKWSFPGVVIPARNSMLVYASGKDRRDPNQPLHTSFQLTSAGEYLALAHDAAGGGLEVVSQFLPSYPQLPDDVSYGVVQTVNSQTVVSPQASLKYRIPTGQANEAGWNQPGYNDGSWSTGSGGVGYQRAVPGFAVRDVKSSTTINNIAQATALLGGQGLVSEKTQITSVVNFIDAEGGGGVGNFASDLSFPNNSGGDDNDFVIRATGTVTIPSNGSWTFGTNSDDGLQLKVGGVMVINDDSLHAPENRFGTISLAAGTYPLELVFFERGGGAEVELFAAAGSFNAFGGQFRLIGDVANGGLVVETPVLGAGVTAGFSGLIGTNVESVMYNQAAGVYVRIPFTVADPQSIDDLTLRVQYDDGFVAYLNGVEIARRNAPVLTAAGTLALTDRAESQAQVAVNIDLSQYESLLQAGNNLLAIHAMNDALGSDEFLIRAELAELTVTNGGLKFFPTPTPGTFNTTATVDGYLLDEISLSHPRGFYSNSFNLAITAETAGTTIRYTTDGSEPTDTNGTVYSSPVAINKTTTLRARAFKAGLAPSNVATATYLFLADVLQQSPTGTPPAGWPASTNINGQILNYGMDPDIVNNATWGPQLISALTQVPSMSLVMNVDDLLHPTTGIYTHANNRGQAWERPGSLELINPDGSTGFQSNAGVRIRGGYSRSGDNPKHAFRFFFRSEYGADKLNFPLFGNEGIDEFDGFDLRTTQNYSWSFGGDGTNTFLRDVFARDVQREMGQPYTRSRYYHLYINGQYWGLYQTQERSEADYAASYFGGSPEDYDVVKSAGNAGGYQNEATDGNMDSYQRLANYFYQPGGLSDAKAADFWKAQGKNPDGSRNLAYERLLDLENLMDYMISTYYQGDRDAPVTRFVPERVNNYFGIFNRANPDGFKFFDHDSEHTLDKGATNLVSQITSSGSNFVYFNPLWMHEQLAASNSQYRMMWADRVYSRLFHDGPLEPTRARALLESRAAEFNLAIIAESARWGDSKREPALTKTDWQNAVNTVLNFVSNRNTVLLSQLRSQGWYPSMDPPQFAVDGTPQHGGNVGNNSQLTLFSSGTVVNSVILPAGSTWKYLDNGTDQGTAWRQTGFADGSWKTGTAELGYGDNDEATTVLFGPDTNNKYITTYFRKSFNVSGLANFQQITLRLKRDDGAIVYLNGKEVVRSNMPANPISYTTPASTSVGTPDESTFFEFAINKSDLVEGTNVLAVELHQNSGGSSDISFDLELLGGIFQAPAGTAYYTLDGSDPMLSNGTVSPTALAYTQPINLTQPVTVNARLRQNNVWSALNSARFVTPTVPPTAANLKITEINYNPHDPLTQYGDLNLDNDEFEYIEITNISASHVDLTGVRFVETPVAGNLQGMTFAFAPQTLGPNQRLVIVSNRLAFQSRYGASVPIAAGDDGLQGPAGEYGGQLNNSGETVRMVDRFGATIQQIAYDDSASWPGRADGNGSSLQIVDSSGNPNLFSNWRNSVEYGGSPGTTGVDAVPTVLINEVLAHTDLPQLDSIELLNTTNAPINMSRWYVSDSNTNYFKYQFPTGAQLGAGAYRVLNENDFNPGGGVNPNDFSLASTGDDVWLLSADPVSGRPLRFIDRVEFDATFNGVSIGRIPNGTTADLLVPLAQPSLGQANTSHRVSNVVISEVHYHPSAAQGTQHEFVEIYNRTDTPVDISNWQLRGGADFDLPNATILPAHQAVVIVSFDPLNALAASAFRTAYGINSSVPLLGPWEVGDVLDNGGENLLLKQPDAPPPGDTEIPYVLVDVATFDDDLPWPTTADGQGSSLSRKNPADFGRPFESWVAAAPTPGLYLESVPAIDLQVLTNGFESPNILTGSQVNWTYQVANTGNVALTGLQVTDNQGIVPTFASVVTGDADNQFEPGEVWLYQASGLAAAGSYTNTGTATASYTDSLGQQRSASDTDGSSYFGAGPALDLIVLTNGSDGPNILTGNNVAWTYRVANTGNVTLSNLQVTDNQGVVPTFASVVTGDADNQFEPGEVWLYQASGLAAAGSYTNTGTANASYADSLGQQRSASDSDGSSYFGAGPALDLIVLTNGSDGPNILTGNNVTWTYRVANTGNVNLTGLQVTDSKGVVPTFASVVTGDADNQFEPGEVWLYQASGLAAAGSYTNTGTANASYTDSLGQQRSASDTDGSSYFGAGPALDLIVLTNGSDGPNILTGNNVAWTYRVANTGNVTLSNLQVTDNQGVVPTFASVVTGDADNQFEPGEVWLYQASGLAAAGSYTNTGTATASFTDSLGQQRSASDSDGSSYFGAGPALDLIVLTNGSDGPNILTGNNVTWTYRVANTGNVVLTGLQVTDSKGVVPAFASVVTGDADNQFEPGEVWLYQASGLAAAGSYTNTGTATASYTDSLGQQRSANSTDGSSYFGAGPALDLIVLTSGSDGPNILTGNDVTWTYRVANTGNVNLSSLQVTDSKGVVPAFASVVTGDADNQFEPGEVWLYQASGLAAAGNYTNTGTATASYTDSLGQQRAAGDTDGSSYFGAGPALDLMVLTNGSDGSNILTGDPVTWTYQVANTGNVTLSNLQVTDNQGIIPAFASIVTGDADNQFEPGEVWLYQASGLAAAGNYANTGTATASYTDSLGQQRSASDSDGSNYFGTGPALDLIVLTNGSDGSNILTGNPVTWTYQVTNTGNVTLSNLKVTDNQGVVPTFASVVTGDADNQFEPGEVWLYQASGLATAGSYANTGTATASYTDSLGQQRAASDTDGSSYFGAGPALDLIVLTNGSDGPSVLTGNNVTWTYRVANTGNVNLTGLQVTDSKGAVPTFASVVTGDADNQFEPGEVWLYQANGLAVVGSYTNTGTATASYTDSLGQPRSASDADGSNYFGASPTLDLITLTNGSDGPSILSGNPVTWTYQVVNTGNVNLSGLQVTDNKGAVPTFASVVAGDADNQFEPGEVWLYQANGLAAVGNYAHNGMATASYIDSLGQQRSASGTDGSSHFGASPALDLITLTNGSDGSNILTGNPVTWTYQVTNTGNVTLSGLQVADNKGVVPTFASVVIGDADNQFEPGEVWLYQAGGLATAGSYTNIGTATASYTDSLGQQRSASDTDGSSYFGGEAAMDLVVLTSGSDGPSILAGNNVTWTYQLTNTGNVTLSNLQVSDNKGVAPTFASIVTGDADNQFEPGEVWLYQASGLAAAGSYTNTGTATASYTDSLGQQRSASDTDGSSYFGASPNIDVAVDANGGDGLSIPVGSQVTWDYRVTNTGNVAISTFQVSDSAGQVPVFNQVVSGDGDDQFEPGEVWLYRATSVAVAGVHSTTGTANASYSDSLLQSRQFSDSDGTSYLGTVQNPADINNDGSVTVADLDALTRAIWQQTTKPEWDLNNDRQVNLLDRAFMVDNVLLLVPGDVNDDQDVDSDDLLNVMAGWTGSQAPGEGTAGWADGDWDGDMDVDSKDLLDLLANWTGNLGSVSQPVKKSPWGHR